MRRSGSVEPQVRTTSLRLVVAEASTSPSARLRSVPDGFEGAPLGWWCPICGGAVAEQDQPLALVEAHRPERDALRWLMPVHRDCSGTTSQTRRGCRGV